jgi:hypothetical protein
MYYRITDHVALRSWPDTGFAIYRRGTRRPLPLSERLAAAMLLAEGEHDMDTDDAVMLLVMDGLIESCERGERPSAWSAFRAYDNACFPMMNLMITLGPYVQGHHEVPFLRGRLAPENRAGLAWMDEPERDWGLGPVPLAPPHQTNRDKT